MKNTIIALLVAILLVSIVNLLAGLGLLGGSDGASGNYEYKALNSQQMDAIGFLRSLKKKALKFRRKEK